LGNGDGTFQAAIEYAAGSNPDAIAAGDFNGDGKLDLAVANFSGDNVTILLGKGDGAFGAPVEFPTGSSPDSIAIGDFNHDGHLDLAVSNYGSNNVSVLLGKGDGTFQIAKNFAVGASPDSVASGDFNADGNLDLAVASEGTSYGGSGYVSVLLGNGDGTFKPAVNYGSPGSYFDAVAVGDFNGDGKLDLAVANYDICNLSLMLGNGDGTFGPAATYAAGSNPYMVAVGDFNGDGTPDLAVANGSGDNVSVLLNTTGLNIVATSVALASSVNPGVSATFTATVDSSVGPPPDGEMVTFIDGTSNTIGTTTLSHGIAVLTTSALTAGQHSIHARYTGDVKYWPSTSPVVMETLGRYTTTTTLYSSVNPSSYGQNVTLTATAVTNYSGTPTGSITFTDGNVLLKTVHLSAGSASTSTAKLSVGTHNITATYSRDMNDSASTSAPLSQVVSQ
jgi:hypothetical protein